MGEEKNFENRVKGFLRKQGCWFIKYWAGAGYTKTGIPDILVCCNGVFLGVEVKATRGEPSDLQLVNLEKIDEAGGYGVLLYPDGFDAFKRLIRAINADEMYTALMEYRFFTILRKEKVDAKKNKSRVSADRRSQEDSR